MGKVIDNSVPDSIGTKVSGRPLVEVSIENIHNFDCCRSDIFLMYIMSLYRVSV